MLVNGLFEKIQLLNRVILFLCNPEENIYSVNECDFIKSATN